MTSSGLSFLTFKLGNLSERQAQCQLAWLAGRPEQVLVLTETKDSAGCRLLAEAFTAAGWHVTFPVPEPGGYGVMIISRVQAGADRFTAAVSYLPARAASMTLPAPAGPVQVIGAYVPSRDAGQEKTERKRKWLASFGAALAARAPASPAVFLGDLNILEPGHEPRYRSSCRSSMTSTVPSGPSTASPTPSGTCTRTRRSIAGSGAPATATATTTSSALPASPR
jgi:exodeoxyribonuclease III